MTHKERLEFCKICKKRAKSMEKGIICSLTGDRAAFDDNCDDFESDAKLIVKQKRKEQDVKRSKQLRMWTIAVTSIVVGLLILVRISLGPIIGISRVSIILLIIFWIIVWIMRVLMK